MTVALALWLVACQRPISLATNTAPALPLPTPAQYAEATPLPPGHAGPVARPAREQFPHAEIVVLEVEEGLRHVFDAVGRRITTRHFFREIAYVRTEGGLSQADVVIPLGGEGRLLQVAGRTFKLDGRVIEIGPSEMIDEEVLQRPGEAPLRRVLFSLPEVEVGDVLEWSWEIETPDPVLFATFEAPAGVPVLRASFWISTGEGFQVHTRATPGLAVAIVREANGGLQHRADGGPFLPIDPEPLSPSTLADPPRFTFSISEAQLLGQYVSLVKSWGDVLEAILDDASQHFGAVPRPPIPLPNDLGGKALALYEWSRDQLVDAPRAGGDGPRGWQTVETERRATPRERVFYLQAQLRRAGIDVRLALARDRRLGDLDPGIVDPEHIDAILLYLPSPSGASVFLDPTCRACAYGDLPWWLQGVPTIVGAGTAQDGSLVTTLLPTPILPSLATRRRVRARVAIEESGDAAVDVTVRLEGISAMRARDAILGRGGDREAARDIGRGVIANLCPRAHGGEIEVTLEPLPGSVAIRWRGRVLALGARAGGRLVVPLSPFSRLDVDPLAGAERRDPVDVPYEQEIDDQTALVLPAGWALLEGPSASSMAAMGGRVEATAPTSAPDGLSRSLHVVLPRTQLPAARAGEIRPLWSTYRAESNAMGIVGSTAGPPRTEPSSQPTRRGARRGH